MLKGDPDDVDLASKGEELAELVDTDIAHEQRIKISDFEIVESPKIYTFNYPVERYPEKINAHNLDKTPEIKGLLQGEEGVRPDAARCVDIATRAALREMVRPGLVAVFAPVVIGYALGPAALGGALAGATVTGVLLALFMANSGGAWDNTKKAIEKGEVEGSIVFNHSLSLTSDTIPGKRDADADIRLTRGIAHQQAA